MGGRYISYTDCPACKEKGSVEIYDASSSMIYSERCTICDWRADLDYYEIKENHIGLFSRAVAKEKGFLCQKCELYLYPYERESGICEDCKE